MAVRDPFFEQRIGLAGPGADYVPVTPDDGTDLNEVAVALYVETAGTVAFTSARGQSRTVAVPDYGWVLCGVRRVLATGTTADGIHAIVVN